MNINRQLLYLALASVMFAQTPAPAPDATAVVGTVDGKDLTIADIQKLLATSEPGFAQYFQKNPADAISKIMFFQYLSQEAERRKLAEQEQVKEQIETQIRLMLRDAVVNDETNNFPVSNEAMEDYYNAHKAEFQQTKIRVIYIGFKSDAPVAGNSPEAVKAAAEAVTGGGKGQHSEAEAKALAADIVKKLREGMDFSKAVAQYSEDPISKAADGDYGVIKIDSAFPEDFRKAVLALKPGEISEPLRQPAGYYIIRGEETTTQPMDELLTPISSAIRKDHMNKWLTDQTERFKFMVKDAKMLQSVTAPGVPPPLISAPPK